MKHDEEMVWPSVIFSVHFSFERDDQGVDRKDLTELRETRRSP